jgi:hypothetical protein
MAEKSGKKTKKKAAKADTGVLGNLSATRPERLGGDRRGATTRASSRPAAATAAKTAAATKPSAAAKPKAAKKPKVRTAAGTAPKPPAAPPKGWQTPGENGRKGGPPGGTEIVTTAVQAAGEIAQLGIAVGGQILKRAAGRIPRP